MPNGAVPARAILDQFDQARRELSADPYALPAWLPILQQYAPALLKQCEAAEALSKRLVRGWLTEYMFGGQPDARKKAASLARYFGSYRLHQSHGIGINRDQARERGVVVTNLEDDPALQDAVLSVHHATMHTFAGPAVKIVENNLGKAYVKLQQIMQVQVPMLQPAPGPAPSGSQPPLPRRIRLRQVLRGQGEGTLPGP